MKHLTTVELFCGTKSFSKVAKELGHSTFTLDNVPTFLPSVCADVLTLNGSDLPQQPEILWASPPCQGFSVAVIGRNWTKPPENAPKTDSARLALKLVQKTIALIEEIKPRYFFIENPCGKLRALDVLDPEKVRIMGQRIYRHKITYCQYGDNRMKPTDIWTNAEWWRPRTACKAGDTCHEAAPRGSRTGTQGRKNATDRGEIPADLFRDIFTQYHDREN